MFPAKPKPKYENRGILEIELFNQVGSGIVGDMSHGDSVYHNSRT